MMDSGSRQSRKVERVPRGPLAEEMAARPTTRSQSRKRKVQDESRNPYVKLMKLGPKQMEDVLTYNTEIMYHDGDLRDDTLEHKSTIKRDSKNKTMDQPSAKKPNPVFDLSKKRLSEEKLCGRKLWSENKPKPKLNIPVAPITSQILEDNVPVVAHKPSSVNIAPVVSKSASSKCRSGEKIVVQVRPLVKAVPSDIHVNEKQSVYNKIIPTERGSNGEKSVEKLVVKIAPVCTEQVDEVSTAGNVKKLKLFWEDLTVKATAVSNNGQNVSEEKTTSSESLPADTLPDQEATNDGKTATDMCTTLLDPQTASTSMQNDVRNTCTIALPLKTPTKTPSKRPTPATPKSPKEVLQDYTKTVKISKSKSPVSNKSSKLNQYQHEIEETWGKKSFRRLFPDPPLSEYSSPETLDSRIAKKKSSQKKRSLMSLNPANYSQFFSPPPNDISLEKPSVSISEPVVKTSTETTQNVADESFIVSESSVEESVSLPNNPSCNDSLNRHEISTLMSSNSEMDTSLFDNSAVRRVIAKTAACVLGYNESSVSISDGEIHDRNVEQAFQESVNSRTTETKETDKIPTPLSLQVMPEVCLRATNVRTDSNQTSVLSVMPTTHSSVNTDSNTALDLTCYELHEKENVPVSIHSQEEPAREHHFLSSYLSSSQLMWSPTLVVGQSPLPRVLTNRKSIKRPRKLVFDNSQDEESNDPVHKRMKPTDIPTGLKHKSSLPATHQIVKHTSSIGKLSQILSPNRSVTTDHEPTSTRSESKSSNSTVSASLSSAKHTFQTSLPDQPRSAIQVPNCLSLSAKNPVSAGSSLSSSTIQRRIYKPTSAKILNISALPSQQLGLERQASQSQQTFFGPNFTPNISLETNSSVFWKQYDSVTSTLDTPTPDTAPPSESSSIMGSRFTPVGSESSKHTGNHHTTYRIQSTKVQQFMTSTPVSTKSTPQPIVCNVRVNAPVSTVQQLNKNWANDYKNKDDRTSTVQCVQPAEQTYSLFDHITNNVRKQLNQQLADRQNNLFSDVIQTDIRHPGNSLVDISSAYPGPSNTGPTTSMPVSQQNNTGIKPEGSQAVQCRYQPQEITAASQENSLGLDQHYGSLQTSGAFVSSLCARLQDLKPYIISGWVSSTYLQALIEKTDLLNDMFSNALDMKGDVKDWVVENCRKSSPLVLARDLVFRIMTLVELERSIIWKQSLKSMPRTKLAAIRRCVQKEFPKSFDSKTWRECLLYVKESVHVLFKCRVPQVQNYWLMHEVSQISNM